MDEKTTYFRQTTPQQRKLLFETWQTTGNVALACRKAQVSRQTFYNWKDRFQTYGDVGLAFPKSHATHHPQKTAESIEIQVIAMRRQNPRWGKRRIADEVAKANGWVALTSPNTVKRILHEAGLWHEPSPPKKGGENPPLALQSNRGKH